MKSNEGTLDRIIRILSAIILVILFAVNIVSGTLGIILLVFAGILLLTGLVGTCPVYSIFGISTCKSKTTTEE